MLNDIPPGLELMPYMRPDIELGVIRPPSEAYSLLLRVQRNCPWNRCEFCGVYKGEKFSVRPVDEIKQDIDISKRYYQEARLWGIIQTAFLQDGNAVVMKTPKLAQVICYLRQEFPSIKRVTTYSSSRIVDKKSLEDFQELAQAGLSRIHIGMESGSAEVLEYQNKGATPEIHVNAGKKVMEAGMELSEYVLFGLGGEERTEKHARESAEVLSEINPDFIRSRTLKVSSGTPLEQKVMDGDFVPLDTEGIIREQRMFLEAFSGESQFICGDHSDNIIMELNGKLPEDKQAMLRIIDRYLGLN